MDFIVEVIEEIIPRFYLKAKREGVQKFFKAFWHVLVWGISIGLAFGGIYFFARVFYAIFGWLPTI